VEDGGGLAELGGHGRQVCYRRTARLGEAEAARLRPSACLASRVFEVLPGAEWDAERLSVVHTEAGSGAERLLAVHTEAGGGAEKLSAVHTEAGSDAERLSAVHTEAERGAERLLSGHTETGWSAASELTPGIRLQHARFTDRR
jgi:hypothetical protein